MEDPAPAAFANNNNASEDVESKNPETQPIALVPQPESPEMEKQIMKELEKKANDEGMKLGQLWYVVSQRWWRQWKEYTSYDWYSSSDIAKAKPGEITNDEIIESGDPPGEEKVKKNSTENFDFVIVSEEMWKLLHHWYGGGPTLPRKVIQSGWHTSNYVVEVRPLSLKVCRSSKPTDFIPATFSKSSTVGQFKEIMCKKMELNPDDVRVWDYHANNKYKLLEEMSQRLESAQIIDGQPMMLEEKDEKGNFPEVPKSRSYNSSSSYYSSSSGGPVDPGTTGLMNLGNTCFMNSSLQCLSHTDPLVDYFLQDKYKEDLNTVNPLGMKGEVAEEYADLVKKLWSGSSGSLAPRELKHKIERFAPQFAGYQQHDSQELLAFLLDGLHEDLNKVRVKPYTENPEVENQPEHEVAAKAWQNHVSRNNSVIVDLFQGQLKSTLVCPKCNKISVTFDPFMYLSLPLPMKTTRIIKVTLFYLDTTKKPMRFGCEVQKSGFVKDLKQALAELNDNKIKADSLVIADVYNGRFFKQFSDKESLDTIQDRDLICAYQLSVPEDESKEVHFYPVMLRREELVSSYNGNYYRKSLFSLPFILSVPDPNKLTYTQLYEQLYQKIRRFLKSVPNEKVVRTTDDLDDKEQVSEKEDKMKTGSSDSDEEPAQKKRKTYPFFTIKSADSYGMTDQETFNPDEEKLLNLEDRTPLVISFKESIADKHYDENAERDIELHSTASKSINEDEAEASISLDKCVELFTVAEKLGEEDPWYCSRCKEFQQATKKFDLWKLPPILVVHLKRFSYKNRYWREKLETFVDYPIKDLDLSDFVLGPKEVSAQYDLFAVSIHFGSLGGGHYIAYAKNKKDKQWYKYDDSMVSKIEESKVKTQSAYVLFYIRKDLAAASNSNSNGSNTPAQETRMETEA